jgi:hypothetical protein
MTRAAVHSRFAIVFMRFPKWTGAPFVDDFGRKSAAMIDLDCEHLFPELAVLRAPCTRTRCHVQGRDARPHTSGGTQRRMMA